MNKSKQLKPYNAWTHLNIGLVYLKQREYEKAFEFFFKSISLDKEDSPEIYSRIGPEFTSVGCYEKAEEYLKKAVDLQEGCNTIRNYIYSFLRAGKYEEALHFVDSIKNYINCDNMFNRFLFQIHVALLNFDQAKNYLPDLQPYDVEGIILNAFIDKKMGKIDFAEEFYDREKDFIFTVETSGHQPSSLLLALAQINAIKENNKTAVKFLLEYEKQFLSEREKLPRYDVIHAGIEIHPIFEDLHGDPDFEAFIERARNMRKEIEEIAIESRRKILILSIFQLAA